MKIQAFHLLIAQSKEVVVSFLGEHGGTMQQQYIQTVTWLMLLIPWDGAIGMIHQDKSIIPIISIVIHHEKSCYKCSIVKNYTSRR